MRYLYLIVIVMLLSCCLSAQTLHFTTTQYTLLQVHQDSSFTIQDTIYNASDTVFTGTISFKANINNVAASDTAVFDTATSQNPITIAGNNSSPDSSRVSFTLTVNTHSPDFIIGPNVIVVWPVYQNGLVPGPNDTIRIPINVTNPLGIMESPLAKAYIYQTDEELHIQFGDIENIVQQVRIYDIEGQQVYANTPQNSTNIPTASWHRGIYLCEISTMSGERRTFKVLLN